MTVKVTNKIACHWLVTRHAGGDVVGPIVITWLLLRCTHAMPPSARSFRVSRPPCLRRDEDVGLAGDVPVAAFSWQSGRHAVTPRRGSSLRMPWDHLDAMEHCLGSSVPVSPGRVSWGVSWVMPSACLRRRRGTS